MLRSFYAPRNFLIRSSGKKPPTIFTSTRGECYWSVSEFDMMIFIWLLVFCVFSFVQAYANNLSTVPQREEPTYASFQKMLLRYLFNETVYDRRVRPVHHHRTPINVTIRLNLYQLVDVSERSQNVVLYCWMTQMWRDQLLMWDPRDFGNLTMVVVPYSEIWLPDTYLYNNLQMVREDSERWINAILEMEPNRTDDVAVTFRYPAIYKFTCNMNVRYFPFDKQNCTMVFGSWTYDAIGITFYPEAKHVAREDFTENEEWSVLSFTTTYRSIKYACCPEPFSLMFVHLIIQRKPLHYLVNLIVPTLIVSLISNIGFFTASTTTGERMEKVSLGISTLLAFAILLLMVSDQMPITSSSVPLVGWFLLGIMLQTAVATLASSIILVIEKRGQYHHRVPPWMRKIFFRHLAPLVGCSMDFQKTAMHLSRSSSFMDRNESELVTTFFENSVNTIKTSVTANDLKSQEQNGNAPQSPIETSPLMFNAEVRRVNQKIQDLNTQLKRKQSYRDELARFEWEWLAAILDRICLIMAITSVLCLGGGVILIGYMKAEGI